MIQKLWLILFLVSLTLYAQGQQVPGKQLRFSDYRGTPNPAMPFKAFTLCNISYQLNRAVACDDAEQIRFPDVTTQANFDPQSWIRDKNSITPSSHRMLLLLHEQGHYDLFKVYSLELKQAIQITCFDQENYRQEVEAINHQLFLKYDQIQRAYDEQTVHGTELQQQAIWKQRIWNMYQSVVNNNT